MKRIFGLLIVILFILLSVEIAKACEPYPEPWFTETITFLNTTLPEGITVRATDPEISIVASIWVINQSEDPIFVLSVDLLKQQILAGNKEQIFLDPSKAYKSLPNQNNPHQLEMSDLLLLDSSLKDLNPVNMSRPAESEIQLPTPSHSQLVLLYLDQLKTIPFTITYSINPHNSVADCNRWYEQIKVTESAFSLENKKNLDAQTNELLQNTSRLLIIAGAIILGVITMFLIQKRRKRL